MKSAEGALTVQDVYEVTDSDGNKSRARRDLQHQIYIGAFFADMPGRSKAISVVKLHRGTAAHTVCYIYST